MELKLKFCNSCKTTKEDACFGTKLSCRECVRAQSRDYRKRNLQVIRAKDRARHHKRKHARRPQLGSLKLYGITSDQYYSLLVKQCGVCAICKKPETSLSRSGKLRRLSVDHNHETGKVRGLLCFRCNVGIGYLLDDVSIISSAITYLQSN